MRRLEMLGIAAVAVLMFAVVTTASATTLLPTLLYLPGGSGTDLAVGETEEKAIVEFESVLGEKIVATGLRLELTMLSNDSKLGPYRIKTVGTEFLKTKCNNVGSPVGTGEVFITGNEWHLVFIALGTALNVGLLLLIARFEIECGKAKVMFEGLILGKFLKIPAMQGDFTELGVDWNCTAKGKQELTKYENDGGTLVSGILKMDTGLGFETACLRTGAELVQQYSIMVKIDL